MAQMGDETKLPNSCCVLDALNFLLLLITQLLFSSIGPKDFSLNYQRAKFQNLLSTGFKPSAKINFSLRSIIAIICRKIDELVFAKTFDTFIDALSGTFWQQRLVAIHFFQQDSKFETRNRTDLESMRNKKVGLALRRRFGRTRVEELFCSAAASDKQKRRISLLAH